MNNLFDQAVTLIEKVDELSNLVRLKPISNKKLLVESELAFYFNRSTQWTRKLRKKGVLMKNKHFYNFNGLILYNREQIESDIILGTISI